MDVYIEVSKNSKIKYEYDKEKGMLVVDRVLHNTNVFPYNYGFVPNTLAPDGDPLDVIVLCDYELQPGCVIKCKILGGIDVSDEEGKDDKIICVPDDKIDPKSKKLQEIMDINEQELENVLYFLRRYKDGENGKFINVGEVYNREKANEFVKESFDNFNSLK